MYQFKPGDWITSIRYNHLNPVKIKSTYKSSTRPDILGLKSEGGIVLYSDEVELWTPKKGEWVVIADDSTPDLYAVFKFNNHSRTKQILPLQFLHTLKEQHGNTH